MIVIARLLVKTTAKTRLHHVESDRFLVKRDHAKVSKSLIPNSCCPSQTPIHHPDETHAKQLYHRPVLNALVDILHIDTDPPFPI